MATAHGPRGMRNGDLPVLDDCRTPAAIEERSFAIIDAEAGEPKPFTGRAWQIARRLVHTTGDFSLLPDLCLPDAAIDAGLAALGRGAAIFTDTEMARSGIPLRRVSPLGCLVRCILAQPEVADKAAALGSTRTYAGITCLGDLLGGSILVVGNAPTALLALFDHLERGGPPPALVIGMPVGFVNAAESKELLLRRRELPSLVLRGRRGGSPLAAATLNALAVIFAEEAAERPGK